MPTTRNSLTPIARRVPPTSANVGLWLDRYFYSPDGNQDEGAREGAKQEHLQRACTIAQPPGYKDFFIRRKALLESLPNTLLLQARATGRLVVGLGRASVWENGLELLHAWGTPIIPGSSLKGLAAAFAHQHLEDICWRRPTEDSDGGESHKLLFGTTEQQGIVTFHDALWIPNEKPPLRDAQDILTVHHRHYYQQEQNPQPPADWDSPVPIPFLSVSGSFLFALSGPRAWVEAAFAILKLALREEGVGAKTSSSYGRMSLEKLLSEEEQLLERHQKQIDIFHFPQGKGELGRLTRLVRQLEEDVKEDEQLAILLIRLLQKAKEQPKDIRDLAKEKLKGLAEEHQDLSWGKLLQEKYEEIFVAPPPPSPEAKSSHPSSLPGAEELLQKLPGDYNDPQCLDLAKDWAEALPAKPTNKQRSALLAQVMEETKEKWGGRTANDFRKKLKKILQQLPEK